MSERRLFLVGEGGWTSVKVIGIDQHDIVGNVRCDYATGRQERCDLAGFKIGHVGKLVCCDLKRCRSVEQASSGPTRLRDL